MLHVAHLCVNASITAASHKDQAYVRTSFLAAEPETSEHYALLRAGR